MNWKLATILAIIAHLATSEDLSESSKIGADGQRVVAIMRNTQHEPDVEGRHSSDFEAENGIKMQLSGSEGENGGANMAGVYSYPMEDGKVAEVTFVADENGYQPQSDLLPVAPAFPHPIPQFVLDQIAFAREQETRQRKDGGLNRAPNNI